MGQLSMAVVENLPLWPLFPKVCYYVLAGLARARPSLWVHLGVCCVSPFPLAHWSLLLLSAVLSMHACVRLVKSIAWCLGLA